jgi:hypothetical protein
LLENIAIIVVQTLEGKSMNLGNNLFDARKKVGFHKKKLLKN